MYVLIKDCLSSPPSEILCFRDLSLYISIFLQKEVLLLSTASNRDIYWRWLKKHGAMDFITDIIDYYEIDEYCLFIDREKIKTPTIQTDRITTSNLDKLRNQAKMAVY